MGFAFKNKQDKEDYKHTMKNVMNIEKVLECPITPNILKVKAKLKPIDNKKKTLVFCGIEGLFLFTS